MNEIKDRVKATLRTAYTPYNKLKEDLGFDDGDHLDMAKLWKAARGCQLARQARHQVYPSLRRRYNLDGSIKSTYEEIGQQLGISIQAARSVIIRRLRRMRHGDMRALYEVRHE